MVGWHHRLSGQEFEQALGDNGGQKSLASWSLLGLQRVGHDFATEEKQKMGGMLKILG